jgi:hypothetical protein
VVSDVLGQGVEAVKGAVKGVFGKKKEEGQVKA